MDYIASDNQEQRFMRVFLRVYPIVFLFLSSFAGQIYAQDLNPTLVYAKVLQGEEFTQQFTSNGDIVVIDADNVIGGSTSTEQVTLNLTYNFTFRADDDFVGQSKIIVELVPVHDRSIKVYSEVYIDVVPSLVEAVQDYVFLPKGQNQVTIDALANDISGRGQSRITALDLVENGNASINNGRIRFTKPLGFSGESSFNYTIEDADGYSSTGVVTVIVEGDEPIAGKELNYLTNSLSPVHIIVDDPSYVLSGSTELIFGEVDRLNDYVMKYTPEPAIGGVESFVLLNDLGEEVEVRIEIIKDLQQGYLVRDDVFYTSVGTTISFDPFENDFTRDGALISYSPELAFDGTLFTYTPEAGFSGVKTFYYAIVEGQKEMKGIIELFVGDYLPVKSQYSFQTFENTELVIEYKAPITNFSWRVVDDPYDGDVDVNVNSRSFICNEAIGYHMVIYTPKFNFTGQDEFTIEYCVDNGSCKSVRVFVDVLPSAENCNCIGSECVWAGDADNDGKVSVKDILSIGYNFGQTGEGRDNVSDAWGANFAEDWPFDQDASDINNKYADSNGDGLIDSHDADVLNTNLDLYHGITTDEILAQKEVPITFVGPEGTLKKDQEITLEVYIGSEEHPVLDLRGITFGIRFPTDKVDPNSIKFTPIKEWLGQGSPVLTAINKSNGTLEVGMARTSGNVGVFGRGKIGETRLVLREDIDGLQPDPTDSPFDIIFENVVVNNSEDKRYKIDTKSFQLNIDEEIEKDFADVVVYPNPSSDRFTLQASQGDQIQEITLYSMTGSVVQSYQNVNRSTYEIRHNLPSGLYTATVTTTQGVAVEKIQVIQE